MSEDIRHELRSELLAKGFKGHDDMEAPGGTMSLTNSYADAAELAELLDLLVARREKVFRSVDVVGEEVARKSYEDVVAAIEAVKVVIGKLTLR